MPRRIWPGGGLLASLAYGWFLAAGARAELQMPPAGSRLEPGATVEVFWTLEQSLPADFDEMELVLSLDGGKTFPVRVTRGISPAIQGVAWRVPALPTEHARLALRTGSTEEPSSETIRLVGAEFVIAARPAASVEPLFRVRGEWRTQEALASPVESPLEASLGDLPATEMRAALAAIAAAQPPRSFTVEGPDRSRTMNPASETAALKVEASPPIARSLSIPLRQ